MKRTALILMIIALLSKFFGFFRDIILSYFYGASSISDAFLISQIIPWVIFGFIGVGITTGYIPMYSKIEKKYGTDEANKFTNNLVNMLMLICTVLVVLGLIFTEQIVKAFAWGMENNSLAVNLTKVSLIGVYFTGLIFIFKGFLELKGDYAIPALIGFPMNLIIILSIYISTKTDTIVLAFGIIIATASQLLFLLPFTYKRGFRYRLILNFKDKHIKNMALIAIPAILGVSVNQINMLIDRTLASQVATGGISALNYANRLNQFTEGIVVISVVTALYPMISKMAADDNVTGLKNSIVEALSAIFLIVTPATIGSILFAEELVTLLFGRGAFDSNAVTMTTSAFLFYSIGMIGIGSREVLSRAFYSLQDTKTPVVNAAIAMILNIILNFILSKFYGIGGLALATSISAIFCSILLYFSLKKKIGSLGTGKLVRTFIKVLVASLMMGVLVKVIFYYSNLLMNQILSLFISIILGSIIYLIIIYLMKIDEINVFVNIIKKVLKKKSKGK